MPLYLCRAGTGSAEPWRQGVQVYAAPHDNSSPVSLRRVRHAEVVLVDDICIAHGQYWLRLRWPGSKGGFAGYIAVQDVVTKKPPPPPPSSQPLESRQTVVDREEEFSEEVLDGFPRQETQSPFPPPADETVEPVSDDLAGDDAGEDPDALMDDGGVIPSEPDTSFAVTCLRTGLPFLTSQAMSLLPMYDDGISPHVALTTNGITGDIAAVEPVFCRICREGLHDDADDEQPSPAEENDAEDTNHGVADSLLGSKQNSRQSSMNTDEPQDDEPSETTANTQDDAKAQDQQIRLLSEGPVVPHPGYLPNPHALENPLLAPCECSGSMAFVHYLCVEQWRCRSRHPEAENGLNCETCGSAYSLPPPASRPVAQAMEPQAEDWLDAMPPHVMQALRQPHILWQIGAAVVRRRWLRPLAPIFMSPIVALYCRARRLLKKRGVARRRWACSLCRRRARWKCVRCLRSYYCSRQCQNVSWHIVHKHVCYKPSRLWWSTVVYGALCFVAFPGILRDPLMYDLGLFLFPFSFIVIGILAGGIATLLKKSCALDFRGRMLELTVVLGTLWLTAVSWGLVQGFFGHASACTGTWGRTLDITDLKSEAPVLYWLQRLVLKPAQSYYLMWDRLALQSGPWLQSILCLQPNEGEVNNGCFEYLPHADANFFCQSDEQGDNLEINNSDASKCAADLVLVGHLYVGALVSYVGSALYKYHERRQRRQPRAARHHHHRGGVRPHQD